MMLQKGKKIMCFTLESQVLCVQTKIYKLFGMVMFSKKNRQIANW
ncbi:hypothetical protein Gotri_018675 [Gossypium trilobum]|uniref:Uncharacterized protein n=1 Tax=Gossypium trilobum TaxID=34281 RepID=A0A7J9EAE5_9ROSI|nr:hypothetical protein [Gossypium trilobum]